MSGTAIAVAVSGGVDSLYALATLKAQGRNVIALHARLLPRGREPSGYEAMLGRLQAACDFLGVHLHIADCATDFDSLVITPFIEAYAACLTPNPCARCNAAVKFGLFLDIAASLGASRIATGHYARLELAGDGTTALYAGKDRTKDQSYFLALVPGARLARAETPLAGTTKNEVRAVLAGHGIAIPAPGESQEICFAPNDDYRSLILSEAPVRGITLPGPGPVVLPDGTRIATHNGLWHYTEGQRRGLGIAWKEPLYVLAKDTAANTLVVGPAASLSGGEIRAVNVNCLVPHAEWPETVHIRTRFRQSPREAQAFLEGDTLILRDKGQSGPHARGQIAVVYAKEVLNGEEIFRVLAGGVIAE